MGRLDGNIMVGSGQAGWTPGAINDFLSGESHRRTHTNVTVRVVSRSALLVIHGTCAIQHEAACVRYVGVGLDKPDASEPLHIVIFLIKTGINTSMVHCTPRQQGQLQRLNLNFGAKSMLFHPPSVLLRKWEHAHFFSCLGSRVSLYMYLSIPCRRARVSLYIPISSMGWRMFLVFFFV